MNLEKCSDEKLVALFLNTEDNEARGQIRDRIFQHYYEGFDRTIRAVLESKGLLYLDMDEYYNDIFTAVYNRVFPVPILEAKLKTFDSDRGNFRGWFLRVMRNEVIGWLRKKDSKTGLTNEETLREKMRKREGGRSLHEPVDSTDEKEGLTHEETISIPKPSGEERDEHIKQAIENLADSHRVILRLSFVAYSRLYPEDIEYISKKKGESCKKVEKDVNGILRDRLRESKKFKECENKQSQLYCLKLKAENLKRRIFLIKEEVFLNQNDLKDIKKEVEKLSFGKIRDSRKGLKSWRDWRDIKQFDLREALKQLSKTTRKRNELLKEYQSGKLYVSPSYEERARILGISIGRVGGLKNEAKEALGNELFKGELENQW